MNKKTQLHEATLEMLTVSHDIPTLPDRFFMIQNIIDDETSTLADLTKAVETDQATAAALVKIANSTAYNRLGNPVSSLDLAISRLGREQTCNIALSMALLYGFSMPAGITVIRKFWVHAFAVGQISRMLVSFANKQHKLSPDTLFLTGLMHDIGKALIGMRIDHKYFESNLSSLHGDELTNAEVKCYGMDHAEAGSCILKTWGFPSAIYAAVATHHSQPNKSIESAICALACHIAHQYLPDCTSIEEVESMIHGSFLEDTVNKHEITEHPLFLMITNEP